VTDIPRRGKQVAEPDYHWVDSPEGLEAAIPRFLGYPCVAMDTEADSLYRYEERICLIQISCPGGDWLIDALALPTLGPLRRLLEEQSVEKVFHGADYDIRLLKKAGIQPKAVFDTMVAAQILGIRRVGLSDLLRERFGIELVKRFQKADWGRRPLPPDMVRYALEDTRHLLRLREALLAELEAKGRLGWARRQFDALLEVRPAPRTPPDALRVPGARNLDDRGRAILQSLLDWREEVARKRDLPPFKVVGTEVLLKLAMRAGASSLDFGGIPGLTEKVIRTSGQGIREAIQRGYLAHPIPWSPRKRPQAERAPMGGRRRLALLKAVRDRKARDLGLDPGVLCPNAALKTLAVSSPREFEERLEQSLSPWQRELLAAELRGAILGGCR